MRYSVKGFLKIYEEMVQTLLMLEVHFIQDSGVENLFYNASFGGEPSMLFLMKNRF